MAHWIGNTKDFNGFVRQARACMLDSPRVSRSTTKDLAITGYVYNDSGDAARAQSDIGFVVAEQAATYGVYRGTCLVAGGASSWDAGVALTVTFTAGASGTIQLDDNSDWTATHGFTVGDLIRIENAEDTINNDIPFRIAAIANNNATNDLLTVSADDVLAAESADAITAYPIGGGAIFELEKDTTGNGTVDQHEGFFASNIEAYSKAFDLWVTLNRGNADWVVGDYWEFTLEEGPFTRLDNIIVTVSDVVISGTNVMTLSAKDIALGVTWASLGFSDENRFDISVSSGADTGAFRIDAITATALTVLTLASGAPGLTNETVTIEVTPKFEVSSSPLLDVVPTDPTLTRDDALPATRSWIDDGFVVGGYCEIEESVSNDGYWLVKTVTDLVLTLDDSLNGNVLVTEVLPATITVTPRNGAVQKWTEHRYRLAASGESPTSTADAISSSGVANGRLIRPDSEGNYVSEWIGIGPGIDPVGNPQTVYIGMQSQFTGSTKQNIEHRVFDVVSDSSFSLMLAGEADVRGYTYMSVASSIETLLEFDGDHLCGFSDINTATTTWFYQGFISVRGTQNQIPRPMYLGTNGYNKSATRATSTSGANGVFFFLDGISKGSGSGFAVNPQFSTGWFRWLDGQWFGIYHSQVNVSDVNQSISQRKIAQWPWFEGRDTPNSVFGGQSTGFFGIGGTGFRSKLGRTPTSFDAADRHYVYTPATLWMDDPDQNIIGDLKGIFFIPGVGGLATKDRQVRGHRVFYSGQNHKATGAASFAALELT